MLALPLFYPLRQCFDDSACYFLNTCFPFPHPLERGTKVLGV